MDFFYSIVSFFGTGGIFMYPILIVFAVGVAIASRTLHNAVDCDAQEPCCLGKGSAFAFRRRI